MAKVLKKLDAFQRFVDGYKTYITAGVILAVGILEDNGIRIPVYVWSALAAAGLSFLRMGVEKSKATL